MKARLGQNFIIDHSVLDYEAKCADVGGKTVLEIGAGDGRLTAKLLSHGAKHITAVELDPNLASQLRKKFALQKKVKVHEGDILQYSAVGRFDRVVGNIPYYITSPILIKLGGMDFGKAVLCLQKEVGERMVAEPGTSNYGRLSVFCQLSFKMQIVGLVSREAFFPKPKVDSCLISLERTGFSIKECESKAIGAIFAHRKKTLRNAVIGSRAALFGSKDKRQAAKIAETLKYCKRKVFTLSPKEALETAKELCRFFAG